jgi:hypothetical protein
MQNALLDVLQGASNAAASTVSVPVDLLGAALRGFGIPVPENALGSSAWMRQAGLTAEPRNPLLGMVGETTGMVSPLVAAARAPQVVNALSSLGRRGSIQVLPSRSNASKSVSILDPKPTPQRPFHADYPKGATGPDGGRLAVDIDGNPLLGGYVAGRRVVGGADEAIDAAGVDDIGGLLGAPTTRVSARELGGDAGRYTAGAATDGEVTRRIRISESLSPDQAKRVQAHEVAHLIDDLVRAPVGVGGSRIPVDGLKKELAAVYEQLNTPGWFKPGRGMTPAGQGYKANAADGEMMAEAIRAYMRDPNWLKTVAPKTAARIRQHVNTNPSLNRTIQFNSLAPTAGVGLLGYGFWPDG